MAPLKVTNVMRDTATLSPKEGAHSKVRGQRQKAFRAEKMIHTNRDSNIPQYSHCSP